MIKKVMLVMSLLILIWTCVNAQTDTNKNTSKSVSPKGKNVNAVEGELPSSYTPNVVKQQDVSNGNIENITKQQSSTSLNTDKITDIIDDVSIESLDEQPSNISVQSEQEYLNERIFDRFKIDNLEIIQLKEQEKSLKSANSPN